MVNKIIYYTMKYKNVDSCTSNRCGESALLMMSCTMVQDMSYSRYMLPTHSGAAVDWEFDSHPNSGIIRTCMHPRNRANYVLGGRKVRFKIWIQTSRPPWVR